MIQPEFNSMELAESLQRLHPDLPYSYTMDQGVLSVSMQYVGQPTLEELEVDPTLVTLLDPTLEEVEEDIKLNGGLVELRMERDSLIVASDWTQFTDAPLTETKKSEWAVYRQKLRDLPAVVDRDNPVMPTKPG